MNDRQLLLIDYLREENRVLREQLGGKRLRFTDDQRRRLAVKAKELERKVLIEMGRIVTPETLPGLRRSRSAGAPFLAAVVHSPFARPASQSP